MYQLTTLSNGLRVATEKLLGVEAVSIAVTVGVGARYEQRHENGLSHMLEHMAFKGTSTRSARDIAESFDNIGGQLNAYTSMENTVYYARILKQDAPFALEVLADILQDSVFAEEELARERDVILQEIAMHHDSPEDAIVDHFDATCFPDQPLGRSILGTEELVRGFDRQHVMEYMQRYYIPSNIVISAAGNVDHDAFVTQVESLVHLKARDKAPAAPLAKYIGGEHYIEEEQEQLHVMFGFPTVSLFDPNYYAMQLYAAILGGGMSSRLFQEVREKRGLAYAVYAAGNGYDDVGMMNLYAATTPEKKEELLATIREEVEKMRAQISDVELQRAKNQSKAELLMARENSQAVAGWIGRHVLRYGDYRQVPELCARIDAVTAADIRKVAADISGSSPTLVMLGNL